MSARQFGKGRKRRRGLHKKATSPETRRWNAEELVPPRPPWMPPHVYRQLAELRGRL